MPPSHHRWSFGLGTLLLVVTGCSLLFAAIHYLDFDSVFFFVLIPLVLVVIGLLELWQWWWIRRQVKRFIKTAISKAPPLTQRAPSENEPEALERPTEKDLT